MGAPLAERDNGGECSLQRLLAAPDTGVILHRQLQVLVQLVWVLAWRRPVAVTTQGPQQVRLFGRDLRIVDGPRRSRRLSELRRGNSGTTPEDEYVAEGVAAEAVGPVQTARCLTGSVEAGNCCRRGLGLDANAAHRVVNGRPNFHGLSR